MDDEDSSIKRGLGQPRQKMNEQAATWNKVLATGQEIPKVQKDSHRCVEKKLRNRYHARGSDDQDTSMSIISAEKTHSWTPWNLHTELRYTDDTYNLVVYSSFISAIKAPSKSTQKRAIIKRYKENEVAETASSSTESPIQILR